jgi:hypothetical protein
LAVDQLLLGSIAVRDHMGYIVSSYTATLLGRMHSEAREGHSTTLIIIIRISVMWTKVETSFF